jgi:ABC-type sulfate transport system permease component
MLALLLAPETNGTKGLAEKINSAVSAARGKVGAERDHYFVDVVFPLLDEATADGYSVEYIKALGKYTLVKVGENWAHPEIKLKSLY